MVLPFPDQQASKLVSFADDTRLYYISMTNSKLILILFMNGLV